MKKRIMLLFVICLVVLSGCGLSMPIFTLGSSTSSTTLTLAGTTSTVEPIDSSKLVSEIYSQVYDKIKNDIYQSLMDDLKEQIKNDSTVVLETLQDAIFNVVDNKANGCVGVLTYTIGTDGVKTGVGTGSGVIYKKEANPNGEGYVYYLFTNHHVIEKGNAFEVQFIDETYLDLELVGATSIIDIAVLKFTSTRTFEVTELGDSDMLKVGEIVLACGNPKGTNFFKSFTYGIVSGKERYIDVDGDDVIDMYVPYIQHDAAINPGNSGGALFDLNGKVVGVNVIKYAATDIEGMGFAIPINLVKDVIEDIEETGSYNKRPTLGIEFVDIAGMRPEAKEYYNIPSDINNGFLINNVIENSSCYGYVQAGDIIIGFDDHTVVDTNSFIGFFGKYVVGDQITVKLIRNGELKEFNIVLKKSPTE